MKNVTTHGLGLYFLCCIFSVSGNAQVAPEQVPGSADPGRFQERFLGRDEPSIEFPQPKQQLTPKPQPKIEDGFVLKDVVISGNTVFLKEELQDLYKDYLNNPADFSTLDYIVQRITAQYRESGYFLSKATLPEQIIENGTVRIKIIEGYVSDVHIEDETGDLAKDRFGLIESYKNRIKSMRPLHGPTLERYLLLMNELGGVKVSGILGSQAKEEKDSGAIDLTLQIKDKATDSVLYANNYGSKFTGPYQSEFQSTFSTPLIAFDKIQVNVATSIPMDEMRYVYGRYTLPLSSSGLEWFVNAGYSDSAPGYTLKDFDIKSDSYTGGMGLSYPLIKTRSQSLVLTGEFESRDILTDFLDTELSRDHLRVARITANYNGSDHWNGINSADLTISKGLNILGASDKGNNNLSREEGDPGFTKVELGVSRIQFLPYKMQLKVSATSQYTTSPLLSSEEFGYGGQTLGRAYDPSEITGDKGISASIELAYNGLPSINNSINVQPFAFYDIGKVWNLDRVEGLNESGASTGLGLNIESDSNWGAKLLAAIPLTRKADNPVYGDGAAPKVTFELHYRF